MAFPPPLSAKSDLLNNSSLWVKRKVQLQHLTDTDACEIGELIVTGNLGKWTFRWVFLIIYPKQWYYCNRLWINFQQNMLPFKKYLHSCTNVLPVLSSSHTFTHPLSTCQWNLCTSRRKIWKRVPENSLALTTY